MYVCSYSSKNYQKLYVVIDQKINLTFENKKMPSVTLEENQMSSTYFTDESIKAHLSI